MLTPKLRPGSLFSFSSARPQVQAQASARWCNCTVRRRISNLPPRKKVRTLDVQAAFRPPRPASTQLADVLGSTITTKRNGFEIKGQGVEQGDENIAFVTSSNVPAATSFQDTASPAKQDVQRGVKVVDPVPAMKALPPSTADANGAGDGDDSASKVTEPMAGTKRRTKEMIVQGVVVPPKPLPPGEEECCMSGCVHCVYTIYADDLEVYVESLEKARRALTSAGIKEAEWPRELRIVGGKAGENAVEKEKERVEEAVDPSLAAFLALENKLKKK